MKLSGHNADALLLQGTVGVQRILRDADGLPLAVLLLAPGTTELTIDGHPAELMLSSEDLSAMAGYYDRKRTLIPVDCEHLLAMLARVRGIDESDLIAAEPILGERAAAGFAALELRDDGLWARFDRWSARARELLSADADRMYAYFSPVIRGIKKGPLRITSLALTNRPAINAQDMLAAADVSTFPDLATVNPPRRQPVKLLLDAVTKLAGRLGQDAAALSGEDVQSDVLIPFVEAAEARIGSLLDERGAFIQGLPESLQLSDDASLQDVCSAISKRLSKADGDALSLTEMTSRLEVLEGDARKRLIADLRAEGKLTEAMVPWAEKQDSVALTDWAKTAPVVVPQGRAVKPGDTPAEDDALVMTDTDIRIARQCGVDPAKVAEVTGKKMPAKA